MAFKDTAGAHQIQAFGRSSYLGQLYDARTSTLLPGFRLFSAEQIKNNFNTVNINKSNTSQHEVRSINDRSSSLNVSAELEVTILSGVISIGGSGSYLNSKEDTTESITVSCVARHRTQQETLEVSTLRSEALTGEEFAKTGATHFVASITYGGDIIASLTQQSNNQIDNTDIKGSFNLDVFKRMGKVGAGGKAELTIEDREKINSFNLKVDFSGDVSLKGESTPTNAADLITLFKKSGDLVGDGVPCEIDLLPLTMLQSDIPTYRELAVSELKQISHTYTDIIKLDNSRIWLKNSVHPKQDLFPTFFDTISNRTLAVSELVHEARSELAAYLRDFRSGTMTLAKPADFKNSIEKRFVQVWKEYRADLTTWRDYLERLRAAEIHAFPAVSVTELTTKMNRADKALIAVILVPEEVMYNDLLNNYRNLAGDIRQWRKSVEESAKCTDDKPKEGAKTPPQTEYMSIYADEQNDEALHRLDDPSGSLKPALATARKTSNIAFLTYGVGKDKFGSLGWNVLNEEGWGIIINKEENWRYIGNIERKLPHGSGVMTFIDGTRYSGDWLNGLKEGEGELLDKDGNTIPDSKGIYVRNDLVSDGVVVSLTVYNKLQIPIDKRSIVLRSTDSARAHVEKIGRAMGWSLKQEFKLQVDDGHSLVVNGDIIDPNEPPSTPNQFWTLKSGTKIAATPIRV